MQEEALELAMALGRTAEEDRERLNTLCGAALEELKRRLKPGVEAEDCGPALTLAAAWTALADLAAADPAGGVESFTAGSVTIRQGGAGEARARSRELRERAEQLMAPYTAQRGFSFQGVRG